MVPPSCEIAPRPSELARAARCYWNPPVERHVGSPLGLNIGTGIIKKKKKTMKMEKQCLGMLKIEYEFILSNTSSFAVFYTHLSIPLRCFHPAPIPSYSDYGAILARGYTITLRPSYGQLVI